MRLIDPVIFEHLPKVDTRKRKIHTSYFPVNKPGG